MPKVEVEQSSVQICAIPGVVLERVLKDHHLARFPAPLLASDGKSAARAAPALAARHDEAEVALGGRQQQGVGVGELPARPPCSERHPRLTVRR